MHGFITLNTLQINFLLKIINSKNKTEYAIYAMGLHKFSSYICNVKFLAVILSIYILGLSLLTCNDSLVHDASNPDIVNVISLDDHSDSSMADLCSPFCSCQCCQVSFTTINFTTHNYLIAQDQFATVYSYEDTALQDFVFSLFQPPQV